MTPDGFEVRNDAKCVARRQKMAVVPLRCELVARKNHLAWKWAVAASWMVEDGVDVAAVTTGRDFVVYLTSSGRLLQCGETPRRVPYDKLCQGRRRSRAHAVGAELKRLTKRDREVYEGHTCGSKCCPVELPIAGKVRVQQVACGATHCVALGEVGTVDGASLGLTAWGVGEYGQLGLGDCQLASKMTPVPVSPKLESLLQNSDGTHPAVLRCGVFSTYLLRRGSSTLWHWGLLPSGEHDSRFVRQGVPVRFPLLDENIHVVDIAAGVEHVVLLSEDGCVFTWGHGSSGQLGIGPSITSNVDSQPTEVDFFCQDSNYRVAAVSCGWNHSVAVSSNGDVYAWGSNAYGACGAKSKFCEYFQPVLVAVPRPVELGLVLSDRQAQIRCGGNSSALLLGHVIDKHVAVERAFLWGVNAPCAATLLPIEVFPFRTKQAKFADCCMGLESSMWLLRVGDVTPVQAVAPAWVIKTVSARAQSCLGLEKGLSCLHADVGAHICIEVQALNKVAVAAIAAVPENEGEYSNYLFELTLEQDDPASILDEDTSTGVSISSVTRKEARDDQVEMHPTVEICIVAQAKGKATLSLTSSIGEVVGNKFVIDIAPHIAETAGNEHDNQGSPIRILGVHVEGTETESQESVDTKWYKLLSKRIRVSTNDTLIMLIESATNDVDPAVQVEYRDNHWQYGLTHLGVIGVDDKSRSQNLGVVQLRFPSPGQYFLYDTKTREDNQDHRFPLLVVSCCMTRQKRQRVLTENHDFVWSKYQSALTNAPQPAQFSFFLSSILQHSTLRESVVCSPWITTYAEECCEPKFDFDREYDDQYVLLLHPERPFILWDPYLTSTPTLDPLQRLTKDADSLNLISIIPDWAKTLSGKVAFRIATWLGKPSAGSSQCFEELLVDYEEARQIVAAIGVSVQQTPFDFLGSVSLLHQRAVRDALVPVNPNITGVHDSIVSWRRTNGDLFYTIQANELFVRRYGHDSHAFPETAQSGRITRLRSQLSDFLWQAAEGRRIEDLFFHLTSPNKPELTLSRDLQTSSTHNIIRFRELIFHTTALGFDEVVAVPKQEWFAVFRGIQALAPPNSGGITFSTFRTLLIDPFHQFFWRQYAHQIREQANSNREMITRTLLESFKVSEIMACGVRRNNNDLESSEHSSGEETLMVPWSDFVESLRSFHNVLGLQPLPPSDCCRLLYRFDTHGSGRISVQTYRESLLQAVDEIDAATQTYDFMKAHKAQPTKGKQPLKVAIASGHRRPNVELFTSSEAVHKLFAARAKACAIPNSPTRTPSTDASRATTSRSTASAAVLRASANTHLARIRNLPISHLLREGIYFRPPYRCEDERAGTQAQAMGAEDSY